MPVGKDNGLIIRLRPKARETPVFTDQAFKSNGLAFDLEGNLLSCDGADGGGRCIRRWNLKTGRSEVVADRYQGKRFNSPNDLCVDLSSSFAVILGVPGASSLCFSRRLCDGFLLGNTITVVVAVVLGRTADKVDQMAHRIGEHSPFGEQRR